MTDNPAVASPIGFNVQASTLEVLPANGNRLYAELTNLSDTAIFLAMGATAVASQGIHVAPSGGVFTTDWPGAINAVHSASGSTKRLAGYDFS